MENAIYLPYRFTTARWGCPPPLISTGAYVGSTEKGGAALDSSYMSDKSYYIISSICKIPGKLSLSSSCRSPWNPGLLNTGLSLLSGASRGCTGLMMHPLSPKLPVCKGASNVYSQVHVKTEQELDSKSYS